MILSTSERIKELREKNGYTQAALAAKLSVTRACVNAWEMGISSPSTENLVELTQIFHVTSDYRNWSTETRSEKRSLSANQSVFERAKFFSS